MLGGIPRLFFRHGIGHHDALPIAQGILRSPAMGMPMSWLYAISIVGFVSTTLRATVAAARFAVLGAPDPHERDEVVST